ncbi:hypothetical protein EON79_05660 [bacterium]|nr:MAG: hypothetical protein EON79_05660 [bacterium]
MADLPSVRLSGFLRSLVVFLCLLTVSFVGAQPVPGGTGGGNGEVVEGRQSPDGTGDAPVTKPAEPVATAKDVSALRAEVKKISASSSGLPTWALVLIVLGALSALASIGSVVELLSRKGGTAKKVSPVTPLPSAAVSTPVAEPSQDGRQIREDIAYLKTDVLTQLQQTAFLLDAMQKSLDAFLADSGKHLNPDLVANLKTESKATEDALRDLQGKLSAKEKDIQVLKDEFKKEAVSHNEIKVRLESAEAARLATENQLAALKSDLGSEPVEPTAAGIARALDKVDAQLSDSPAARSVVKELAALKAVEAGDTRGALLLIAPTAFDPFLYPQAHWSRGIAAKRILENAREAILAYAKPFGFELIRPEPRERYVPERHGKAGEVEAERAEQAGTVARLRRPGLSYKNSVIQTAQVDQFVFDPGREMASTVPSAVSDVPPDNEKAASGAGANSSPESRVTHAEKLMGEF